MSEGPISSPQSSGQQRIEHAISARHPTFEHYFLTPSHKTQGIPMAEEKKESQKAPYVTPKILTLKVDLSFASSVTNFEDLIDLVNHPERLVPGTTETPTKAKAAAGRGKPLSTNP